jgi:hypothetical protein
MHRYLRRLGTFLAPRSVDAADSALRQLARWMITESGTAGSKDLEAYEGSRDPKPAQLQAGLRRLCCRVGRDVGRCP